MDKMKGLFIVNIAITALLLIGFIFMFISINKIVKAINIDTNANNKKEIKQIPKSQIEMFNIDDAITVNVCSSKDENDEHMLRLKVRLGLNSKGKDFKKLKPELENKKDIILSDIINHIRNKTFEEIKRPDSSKVLENEILDILRKEFDTETIVSIYFSEYFHQ